MWATFSCAADDLSGLYEELAAADAETAPYLVDKIAGVWAQSGSPAMDLLLSRGQDALHAGDAQTALGHLTALVDHAPGFAQGYVARARAYVAIGLIGPAIDDLAQALALEPRHFEAMEGLALILQDTEQTDQARAVWAEVQRLNPHSTLAAQALEALDRDLGELEA